MESSTLSVVVRVLGNSISLFELEEFVRLNMKTIRNNYLVSLLVTKGLEVIGCKIELA